MSYQHETVLQAETISALQPMNGKTYLDCTLGGGGHAASLLEAAECRVIGIDRDPNAIAAASERLTQYGARFQAVQAKFSDIARVLTDLSVASVDGVLADLGVSSPQLDQAERGFSFRRSGPVDMRMDPGASLSAATIVNHWDEADIGRVVRDYGEERRWRAVARAIVAGRPWTDLLPLADAVRRAVGGREGRIHPATRTFQGLRIAVNDELGELERLLPAAMERLTPEGRIAIISFHSLEDRIVKHFFAQQAGRGVERDPFGRLIRPPSLSLLPSITPSPSEQNPRARSARLRVAVRLP